MISDLHCHFPMHLLPADRHPHGASAPWFQRMRDVLDAEAEGLLARLLNNPGWSAGWRVDLDGLEQGGARIVCSVLYWPPAEFDIGLLSGSPPVAESFKDLQHVLIHVEEKLQEQDPDGLRHLIVRRATDLDDESRVAFAHCVEGGFHLGPDKDAIAGNVRWLAEHGVVYVTLAHLFFRDVAANAPAIPMLSDREYDRVFPQAPGIGLTDLGRAAVRAMYEHRVLVDVSHMREDAIEATFALLEDLDRQSGADPTEFPVIATHAGIREVGPDEQAYNLSPDTVRRIASRGGVVGLIMAQHQLGPTANEAESRIVLGRHIDAMAAITGGRDHTAIGTDLDGFIKPTLAGIERASDLSLLERWIRADYAREADAILHDNAHRVLRTAFMTRSSASGP